MSLLVLCCVAAGCSSSGSPTKDGAAENLPSEVASSSPPRAETTNIEKVKKGDKSNAVTRSGQAGPLAVGDTAHFPYFDVTVDDHRADGAVWGAHVRVCYTAAHPTANPDGTTRVSTDPWQFGAVSGTGNSIEYSHTPTIDSSISDFWSPAFGETKLLVGQCHAGWVSVSLIEAATGFGGMRYAPGGFGFSAVWRW